MVRVVAAGIFATAAAFSGAGDLSPRVARAPSKAVSSKVGSALSSSRSRKLPSSWTRGLPSPRAAAERRARAGDVL